MPQEIHTCPKCGALIVPQLSRCRQCKAYLHGTRVEGWLFERFLPKSLAASPGTGLLLVMMCAYYVLMLALTVPTTPSSALGFSAYSLRTLGATHGATLLRGEAWRFVTSIFGHHNLIHIALNLVSLVTVGPLVEQLFDRKKMLLMYFLSGVVSMFVSFLWYVYIKHEISFVSAGASGAVCGMIGAAWIGARRTHNRDIAQVMVRWTVYMALWGFMVPGINNAAHFGGFALGAGLGWVIPTGLVQSVMRQRVLSMALVGAFVVIGASTVIMLDKLRGFPTALVDDAQSQSMLGFTYNKGVPWHQSDQMRIVGECENLFQSQPKSEAALHACELNARVNDHWHEGWRMLARLYEMRGDTQQAATLDAIARRLR